MPSSYFAAAGSPIVRRWGAMLLLVISTCGAASQVNETPFILRHPEGKTVLAGEDVRFTVAAVGVEPLAYQWQFRDEEIEGATKPDLFLTGVQIWNAGDYTVVVRNRSGEITSKPAYLRVLSLPVILRQPMSVQAVRDQKVRFLVEAVGTPPLRYQWFHNQREIVGGTNEFLGVAPAQENDAGEYMVHIKNDYGDIFSRPVSLEVNIAPVILTHPTSKIVRPGANATFFVEAAGTPPLRFQWRLNGKYLRDETNTFITISGADAGDAGAYQVLVGNVAGAETSHVAFLKLDYQDVVFADKLAESILVSNRTACLNGHNFQATIDANDPKYPDSDRAGGSSVWIRWQTPLRGIVTFSTRGSTFDTLLAAYAPGIAGALAPVAADDDAGDFFTSHIRFVANSNVVYAILIDGVDGVEGQITLCWDLVPSTFDVLPIIQQQPVDQTASFNDAVRFSVGATGNDLRYQWYFNNNVLTNEIRPTLTVPDVTPLHAGRYHVVIFQGNYSVTSRVATLQFSFVTVDNLRADGFAHDHFKDVVFRPLGGPGGFAAMEASSSETIQSMGAPAPVLGYTGTQIFSTFGSGSEPGEIAHCGIPGGASQWFLFVAPANGTLYLNTEGSNFDTVLAVYQGPGPLISSLRAVECDNNSGTGNRSSLNLPAGEDEIYYIAVDGVNGATGLAHLNYRLLVPITMTQVARPDTTTTEFRVTATPSYPITLERSAGMLTWNLLHTTNVPTSGTFLSNDTNAWGLKRFYRAIQTP